MTEKKANPFEWPTNGTVRFLETTYANGLVTNVIALPKRRPTDWMLIQSNCCFLRSALRDIKSLDPARILKKRKQLNKRKKQQRARTGRR